jgi:hypothetical protein
VVLRAQQGGDQIINQFFSALEVNMVTAPLAVVLEDVYVTEVVDPVVLVTVDEAPIEVTLDD